MMTRPISRWMLVAGIALLPAACAESSAPPGGSAKTAPTQINSSVETVTWADGKQAYSINCDAPGGCMQRTLMICNQGPYKVLKSENMPTTGDQRETRGPASVVVRCG